MVCSGPPKASGRVMGGGGGAGRIRSTILNVVTYSQNAERASSQKRHMGIGQLQFGEIIDDHR